VVPAEQQLAAEDEEVPVVSRAPQVLEAEGEGSRRQERVPPPQHRGDPTEEIGPFHRPSRHLRIMAPPAAQAVGWTR
jgi:hypothetical protein